MDVKIGDKVLIESGVYGRERISVVTKVLKRYFHVDGRDTVKYRMPNDAGFCHKIGKERWSIDHARIITDADAEAKMAKWKAFDRRVALSKAVTLELCKKLSDEECSIIEGIVERHELTG